MKRMFLMIAGPTVLGPALLVGGAWALSFNESKLPQMALFALVCTLPSFFVSVPYAFTMETAFAHGVRPGSWMSVAVSSAVGAIAGWTALWFVGAVFNFSISSLQESLIFAGAGAIVGAATGGLVWAFASNEPDRMLN